MKKKTALLMAVAMAVGMLSGCGGSGNDTAGGDVQAESTGEVQQVENPREKYEETITLTSFFEISPAISDVFSPEALAETYFTQQQEEQTNIHIDYLWYAADTTDDAEQKKNLAIASAEIPDFMLATRSQLALLAKTDLLNTDIGDILQQYATDETMARLTGEGDMALESARYNGKIIAIPIVAGAYDSSEVLWIRKDWLDNLNLEIPETMEDLYDVMVAFKEQDPDGNGQDDTFGMTLHKDFMSRAMGDAVGLFNGFGAYPGIWVTGEDGSLVYGSVQPEIKDALSYLAKMYAEGLIVEDFSSLDDLKATEASTAGRSGIQYGLQWNAFWPLQDTVNNNPEANWIAIRLPSATGSPTRPQIALQVNDYIVVSAKCEHPEAVVKLLNFYVDAEKSELEEYTKYLFDDDGDGTATFPQHWAMVKTYDPVANIEQYRHVKEAVENNDDSNLLPGERPFYEDYIGYMAGDISKAGGAKMFGPEGSAFQIIAEYYDNEEGQWDQFAGPSTDTMTQRQSAINDKVMEYYTKVIMGLDSVDNFDSFVEEVNNLGLKNITAEVNEWYESK